MTTSRDWVTPEGARGLVALFVGVKLLATVWNCSVFDAESYDAPAHARRAASGGLTITAMAYDAPTYYLPALVFKALKRDEWRQAARASRQQEEPQPERRKHGEEPRSPFLGFLRMTNIVYVGAFYLLWIYGVLPRVLPDWRQRLLASLLILALPGYQKLGVMVHPDNLHLALATLCTFTWVRMPGVSDQEGGGGAGVSPWANMKLALVSGLSGLTRPFAAATVAAFTTVNLLHLWLSNREGWPVLLRRGAAILVVTATIAGSWYACRGVMAGTWRESYPEGYMEQFDRTGFDYFHYMTSFHIRELLMVPNRGINQLDTANVVRTGYAPANRYANSFFTTLYSETWGDHWLYFSGRQGADRKIFVKRVLFVLALPLIPLLTIRLGRGAWDLFGRVRGQGLAAAVDPSTGLLLHVVAGASLFLLWQLGSSLSPGKQSSIKFIYNAYLYAPAVTFCFVPRVSEGRFNAWLAYLLLLFIAALPMSIYLPRGW